MTPDPLLSQSERNWLIRMGLTIGLILGFFLGAVVVAFAWVWTLMPHV